MGSPLLAVPGVSTFGVTQDPALHAAATVALGVVAELITKGDRAWARLQEEQR